MISKIEDIIDNNDIVFSRIEELPDDYDIRDYQR